MSTGFGTFRTARRVASKPLEPVIDPAGWEPDDIRPADDWAYHLTRADIAELRDAVRRFKRAGKPLVEMTATDFPLPRLAGVLADLRCELLDGRGFAYMRGLPVRELTQEDAAVAYFGLGQYLGRRISQNADGHLLGHVVYHAGSKLADANTRGYQTTEELGFHADPCDYVGLLCLNRAKTGGASRIASSVTLYNRMLAVRRDLVAELTRDFYWTRHGEVPPGKEPWYKQPVFCFERGYFSGRGVSTHIRKAQALSRVPPFTAAQEEAMALFRSMVPECAVNLNFEEGDIQFLHNNVILHSRTAYADWPEPERRRHLLRLWLSDTDGRPLPEQMRANIQGVEVEGFVPKAPVDVTAA